VSVALPFDFRARITRLLEALQDGDVELALAIAEDIDREFDQLERESDRRRIA
jgi:hypothetical protein